MGRKLSSCLILLYVIQILNFTFTTVGSAKLPLPNCTTNKILDLPTIRVYDAQEETPNYDNNGTVLLEQPEDDKDTIGWPGVECYHWKPVRWVYNLDFESIEDSFAQTTRTTTDYYNTGSYSFKAEVEIKIHAKNVSFVMACMTFDDICERRVVHIRRSYDTKSKNYILRVLSKTEENNTLVAELERHIVLNQDWGQKYADESPCAVTFSLFDNGDFYRHLFQPPDPASSRRVPDRQTMENAYLFMKHLKNTCTADLCKHKTNKDCASNSKEYWPVVHRTSNGNTSTVVYTYHTLVSRKSRARNGEPEDGRLKYAWETSDKEDFMKMNAIPSKIFLGEVIELECHASPFLFSAGTLIGYSNLSRPTSGEKNVQFLDPNTVYEDTELETFGRVAKGNISFPLEYFDENEEFNITAFCFSPVWNSSTEWVNVSRSFTVAVPHLNVSGEVDESSNDVIPIYTRPLQSSFTTNCTASGPPLPQNFEVILPQTNASVNITKVPLDHYTMQANIRIDNLDETHQGFYNCVAENLRGVAHFGFEIRVFKPIKGSSSSMIIAITAGGGSLVLILVAVFIILLVRFRLEKEEFRRLTEEAIKEFLEGVDPALLPMIDAEGREIQHYANDSIKCQPFDSSYEVNHKLWTLSDIVLGVGAFGLVRKGTVQLGSRKSVVAVKTTKSQEDIDDFRATLLELKIMAYVGHHHHIAKLIASSTDEIRDRKVLIGIEFCSNGSLLSYLQKRRKLFDNMVKDGKIHFVENEENSEEDGVYMNLVVRADMSTLDLFKWSYQIASGMEFLESKKILHADLAARNILLTEDLVVKISDFGLSRELFENSEYTKKTQVPLPWKYMAIESLKFLKFSTKTDVWSYGVTLHEIFTLGEEPYPGQSWSEEFMSFLENGMRLNQPVLCTDNVYSKVMMQCWQKEPAERIGFGDAKSFFEKAIGLLMSAKRNDDDECKEFC